MLASLWGAAAGPVAAEVDTAVAPIEEESLPALETQQALVDELRQRLAGSEEGKKAAADLTQGMSVELWVHADLFSRVLTFGGKTLKNRNSSAFLIHTLGM